MLIQDTVPLFIFSTLCFIGVRAFLELTLWSLFPKKGYKKYKKNTTLINRYFLVSAKSMIKDRYSKSEKRIIRYSVIVNVLFYINIIINLAFLMVISGFILFLFNMLNSKIIYLVFLFFLVFILLIFLIYAIIEAYVNYDYHKKRSHWR